MARAFLIFLTDGYDMEQSIYIGILFDSPPAPCHNHLYSRQDVGDGLAVRVVTVDRDALGGDLGQHLGLVHLV